MASAGPGAKILEQHKFLALLFGGLCVLCWSYYNVLCDLVVFHFDNYFILFGAIIVNTVCVSPILKFTYRDLNVHGPKQWASVICFGFFDVLLILLMSYAFQHAPIGDASCLFAMRVLWTPLVEAMVHKKCISLSHAITMLLAVSGAILITQPVFLGFPQEHSLDRYPDLYLAYLLALLAGMVAGMQYIFLSICPDVHWSVWQVMMIPSGLVLAPIVFYVSGSAAKVVELEITTLFIVDLIGCFFIAWFDILGRMCRTVACKEHTPSTVSLVSVLEIPFTYGWGWLWSGQAMGKLEIFGALLVMSAVFLSSIPWFSNLSIQQLVDLVDQTKGDGGNQCSNGENGTITNSVASSGYDSAINSYDSRLDSRQVTASGMEASGMEASGTANGRKTRRLRPLSKSFLQRVKSGFASRRADRRGSKEEQEGLLDSTASTNKIYYQ